MASVITESSPPMSVQVTGMNHRLLRTVTVSRSNVMLLRIGRETAPYPIDRRHKTSARRLEPPF